MGYGFYRLFTPDGAGVESEESLFERADAITRFKKMIATFAVEINRRNELQQFIDNDTGCRAWLNINPDGYVLNTAKNPSIGYVKLHNASCWTIRRDGENYTHGDLQKVCATDRSEIARWVQDVTGGEPSECGTCFKW